MASAAPWLLLVVMLARQWSVAGGPTPAAGQLIAAGGGLRSWLDAPRAYLLHAGVGHLLINAGLSLLFGAAWCYIGRLGDPSESSFVRGPIRVFAATVLAALAGAASLSIAAALTPEARVGASGGVHALLGGLLVAVWIRRHQLLEPLRAGLLRNLLLVTVPLVGLQLIGSDGIDWLAHVLGFALGFPLAWLVERPRGLAVGAIATIGWFVAAAA